MKGWSQGGMCERTTVGTSVADGRGHFGEGVSERRDGLSINDRVFI